MAVYPERRGGRLTGKWIAEVTHVGKRRRDRFTTKLEAERWADYIKVTGSPPADDKKPAACVHTLDAVVKEALERHPGWAGNRDPSRQQRLAYAVDAIGKDKPIGDVTRGDLDALVTKLKRHTGREGKLSAGTINRYLSLVSAVLNYARAHNYRPDMPAVPWQKEAGRRVHWLTDEQEQAVSRAILAEGRKDEELSLRVLTRTGLRWSEFEGLEPAQVTDTWIKLDKTKTDTPRDVPIDPELARELRDMVVRKAVPRYYTFRKTLKRALKSAGQNPKLSVHCLRHTTATRLVHADVNLGIVKDFLGHKSLNTTLKYTHVTATALQDALKKISPHAGQSSESNVVPFPKTPANKGEVEATEGIEPPSTVLQTD